MEKIDKIIFDKLSAGTCDVMEWIDNNPNCYLSNTQIFDGRGYAMMVSDYNPSISEKECDKRGLIEWHPCPNGWERENCGHGCWVCRKNERYIFITT